MAFPSKHKSGSVIENDLGRRYHTFLPLDLLNMAQRIRLRLTQITQYLHMVRHFHLHEILAFPSYCPKKKSLPLYDIFYCGDAMVDIRS